MAGQDSMQMDVQGANKHFNNRKSGFEIMPTMFLSASKVVIMIMMALPEVFVSLNDATGFVDPNYNHLFSFSNDYLSQ